MSTAGEISGRKGPQYYAEPRSHERHGQDWYVEPEWTVDLLLDAEPFNGQSWDPCAGSGTIPRRIRSRGKVCIASDIINRGHYEPLLTFDFTSPAADQVTAENIIMNPPYRQAEEFIRRALDLAGCKVAAIVQAKFPYSQRRHRLFIDQPPSAIYFLSTRPSMPPGEKLLAGTLEAKGGKTDYCWMVWDHAHDGPTTARWLRRAP